MKPFSNKIYTVLLSTVIVSCSQDFEKSSIQDNQIIDDKYKITESEAISIASLISYKTKGFSNKASGSSTKTVSKSMAVPDQFGSHAFYIIEYAEEGFIIISGDKRINPILGFSIDNSFNFDVEKLPSGLIGWLKEMSIGIGLFRRDYKESEYIDIISILEEQYGPCPIQQIISPNIPLNAKCEEPDNGNDDCIDTHHFYGPLINTKWNQWTGFNNLLDNMGCNSIGGRPPSGCVATAVGQIMRHHQFPNSYNWANMPLSNQGSNEVSRLLKDIGTAVNMDYNCNGSGAHTSDCVYMFENVFGYSSASFEDYDFFKVKNEIITGRPVILAGYEEKNCFLFWCNYESGHAWVCEGYSSHLSCDTGVVTSYLYMNYGWGGNYNGYYNSWSPGNYNFKYNKRMIYNIKP